jgi:uncharacterized protein YndB with AHSA1/START domain
VSGRPIRWKVAFKSPPDRVYAALATEAGRRAFWALEAPERAGTVHFSFPNGQREASRIVAAEPPRRFEIVYFGAPTRFDIEGRGGGAVLTLVAGEVPPSEWEAVHAGWVAVLLAMKAHVDFGIDLRNGDPACSWDAGFVDP